MRQTPTTLTCKILSHHTRKMWRSWKKIFLLVMGISFFRGGGLCGPFFLKCFSQIFFPDRVKSMWCVYSKHPSFQGGCFEYTHHILLTRSEKNIWEKHLKKKRPAKPPLKKRNSQVQTLFWIIEILLFFLQSGKYFIEKYLINQGWRKWKRKASQFFCRLWEIKRAS